MQQSIDTITRVAEAALSRIIRPENAAREVARQFVEAELMGKTTHGLVRIAWLASKFGELSHQPPSITKPSGDWLTVYEASQSVGYCVAMDAVRAVLDQLQRRPAAVAICRNCFPSGVMLSYLRPLVEAGYLAIGTALSPPLLSPDAGSRALFGTHPLAMGVPDGHGSVAIVDASSAPVTFGHLLKLGMQDAPVSAQTLENLPIVTQGGARARSLEDFYDQDGQFAGRMVMQPDNQPEQRWQAVNILLDLLGAGMAGLSKRGSVLIAACRPDAMPWQSEDVLKRFGQFQAVLGDDGLPGQRSLARMRRAREAGVVDLPERLWGRLVSLAGE